MINTSEMNIYQKLLKIANMSGVLQKNKNGYNYKYVSEEDIQAKVTAGMQKYGVFLIPSIAPGTLTVLPHTYEKSKTRKEKGETIEYTVPVNEVIVQTEVIYTWVNTDNPEEKIECRWAYIGQMEDASQAFGAGATYGNRYYLIKALQLATTEADPDNYRSKQKEAENYEETEKLKEEAEALAKAIKEVVDAGSKLMKNGYDKETIMAIVGKHNNKNQNPSSIKSIDVCAAIMKEFAALATQKQKPSGEKQSGKKESNK